jgi:hypothetical protein
MLLAAAAFAATTAFTTTVSMRQPHLPDEPLGLRFPGRVPVHLALGLGSGVAAPWPLPLIAVIAALRSRPGVTWPARTCAVIGVLVIVGTLVEPASWGLRPRSAWARAAVPLHLLSGAALFLSGTGERTAPG